MSLCGGHVLASAEWVTRPSSPENLNGYELHLETLPHLTSRVMKRKVQVPCSSAFLLLQLPTLGGWSHPFSGCANHSGVQRKGKLSQLVWEDQRDTAGPGGLLFSGPLTKTLSHSHPGRPPGFSGSAASCEQQPCVSHSSKDPHLESTFPFMATWLLFHHPSITKTSQ